LSKSYFFSKNFNSILSKVYYKNNGSVFLEKKIVHIEIPVKDIQKAKDFYESIFNWEVQVDTGMPGYAFFKTGKEGVGGAFNQSENVAKGEIMLHIQAEDIPNMLKKIEEIGGKTIQEKTEIGNEFGFYAIFEDVFGNVLGLWSEK